MRHNLPAMTLANVLKYSNENFPDYPSFSFVDGKLLTFKEFYEEVELVSAFLHEQGITFGDKVAILAENSPHWGIAYFAITSMGAVAVPILTEFHDDAVMHIIRHSESKAVFVSQKLLQKISESEFTIPPILIDIENFSITSFGANKDSIAEAKSASVREFRKLREKALRLARRIPDEPGEDDDAVIIYTSGTTGHSKGVILTHKNLVYDAISVEGVIFIDTKDRFLSILPLAHTYECTLGLILPVLRGAQVFYLDKPPTPRVLIPALGKVKPTAVLSVPLVIEKIFKSTVLPTFTGKAIMRRIYGIPFIRRLLHKLAGAKLRKTFGGCLRAFCIGGAPLAPDVERFLYEGNIPYLIGYGLTETSPLVIATPMGKTKVQSCGFPLEGIQVRLYDADPITKIGEIMVKGPVVMRGYYKEPTLNTQVFTADGWFHTGDLGEIHKDGRIFIKGRSKNMILGPSGENIYPEEIESIILESLYVVECMVLQQDSKLIARIYLDDIKINTEFSEQGLEKAKETRTQILEEIRKYTNSRTSSFAKLQKIIEQREPFEKTATQKIKRYLYS